jgi:hypothetical protein
MQAAKRVYINDFCVYLPFANRYSVRLCHIHFVYGGQPDQVRPAGVPYSGAWALCGVPDDTRCAVGAQSLQAAWNVIDCGHGPIMIRGS